MENNQTNQNVNEQVTQTQSQFAQQPIVDNQNLNIHNSNIKTEITPEIKQKLTTASNIAVVSGGVIIIATILRIILNFLVNGEIDKIIHIFNTMASRNRIAPPALGEIKSTLQVQIVLGFVMLAIAIGFTILSFFVRKAKRKSLAINLIVFASIFIAIFSLGLILEIVELPTLNTQVSALERIGNLSGKDSINIQNMVQSFKTISGLAIALIFTAAASLIGWIGILVGGILRVIVKDNKPVVKW